MFENPQVQQSMVLNRENCIESYIFIRAKTLDKQNDCLYMIVSWEEFHTVLVM